MNHFKGLDGLNFIFRPGSFGIFVLLAVQVFSGVTASAQSPGSNAHSKEIILVAPGIWRLHVGQPEKFTPTTFRLAPADADNLKQLSPAKDLPLDVKGIDFQISKGGCAIELPMDREEHVYGFGLNTKLFDMTQNGGRRVFLKPTDDPEKDLGESHAPVPFYVSTRGYGVFVDTARFASFYVGNAASANNQPERVEKGGDKVASSTEELYKARELREKTMLIEIPASQGVDIYIFAGPTMMEAVKRYNLFSGGGCVPPLWGLGIQYRGFGSYGADDSLSMALRMRADHMPCDMWGVEPGWQTKTYSSSFVWKTNSFPDPSGFINEMHKAGFRLNFWEHAFAHPSSPMYDALKPWSGNFLVWGGLVPDFSTPEGRRIFLKQNREALFNRGVDSVKLDECDYQPDSATPWSFPTASTFPGGMDGEQMHSLFGILYQQTMLEPFQETKQRTWGLVRNSHGLASPYPYVVYSDSYDHACYVRGLANQGFSGLLWTPEVRHADSIDDLYRRMETVMFSPMALVNCWYMKNPPWMQIDQKKNDAGEFLANHDEVTAGMRKLFQLRMSFVPYLYSAFMEYRSTGTPPIRALVLDYPEDPKTLTVDDQFLFGPSVMVAPMRAGQKERAVYLPKGNWYDFWTHQKLAGGQSIQATNEVGHIPLYIKAGALLPLAEPVDFIKADTIFNLTATQFGTGASECVLYEDDGVTEAFKSGNQNRVQLIWNDAGHTLERRGHFEGTRYQVSNWLRID